MFPQRAGGMTFERREGPLLPAAAVFLVPQRLDQPYGACRVSRVYQQIHVRHRTLAAGVQTERVQRDTFQRDDRDARLACGLIDLQQQFLDSSVALSYVNSLLLEKMHPLLGSAPAQGAG